MKLAIFATLIGSAAAFAPVAFKVSSSALADARSPDGLGVDPGPLDLFDPLGFVEDEESFPRRRAVEIKHGRIAMMAFIGMLVQELGVTFPGSLDLQGQYPFADVLKDGMGFPALANVPAGGLVQIVLFGGLAEVSAMPSSEYTGGPQDLPGGFDGSQGTIPGGYPFTTQIEDPEQRDRTLNVEIQNGRAAMLGVTGAMIHSCLDSCDHHFFYPITHNQIILSDVRPGSQRTIPGGYPFTTQIEDPEQRDRTLHVEIQNGRAAMLGVTGAMIHFYLDSYDRHFVYPITHN